MQLRPLGTYRLFDQNPLRRILSFGAVGQSNTIRSLDFNGLRPHNFKIDVLQQCHCEPAAEVLFRLADGVRGGRSNLRGAHHPKALRLPRTAHGALGRSKGYCGAVLAMTLFKGTAAPPTNAVASHRDRSMDEPMNSFMGDGQGCSADSGKRHLLASHRMHGLRARATGLGLQRRDRNYNPTDAFDVTKRHASSLTDGQP